MESEVGGAMFSHEQPIQPSWSINDWGITPDEQMD